jgi:integrase
VRPWHPDHLTHSYRRLAESLNVVEPLKNLRHFNATQLLAAGVDLRTMAGRLGHSDGGATTLKVYADWLPASDRLAAEQLSGDLAALRASESASGDEPGSAATLQPVARPLHEVLEPPTTGRANYLLVSAALTAAIDDSGLRPGDLVPTVTELADWYGVARSAAQRAVSTLGAEGRATRRGHRWAVTSRPKPQVKTG